MATSAPPRQPEQQRRAAALAAGGALAVTAGQQGQDEPPAPARATAAAVILAALVSFLAVQRARARAWLREQLRKRSLVTPEAEIEGVLDDEERRGAEFERRSVERFTRELTTVLAIPDARQREAAVRGLVGREQRYARQRDVAMAARAFAAIDRIVLRTSSPQGAFWRLDPTVAEHTAGCLFMGGKFWPWAVLDRVHPPRHAGCPCRLLGYGEAVAEGLMAPGDVQDVRKAVLRAAAVVMEGALVLDDPVDALGLIVEAYGSIEVAELRAAMLTAGVSTAERFDAVIERAHDIPNSFGRGKKFGVGGRFAGHFHPGAGGGDGGLKRAARRALSLVQHRRAGGKAEVKRNPAFPNAAPRFDEHALARYEAEQHAYEWASIAADPGPEAGADEAWRRAHELEAKKASKALDVALGPDLAKFIDRQWGQKAGVRRRLLEGEITVQQAEEEAYEEYARLETARLLREVDRDLDYGLEKKPLPCFSCGHFKARPSDVCGYCGDDPVQLGTKREDFDRAYGYAGHSVQAPYMAGVGVKK